MFARIQEPDGSLGPMTSVSMDHDPGVGSSFALDDGRWVELLSYARRPDGGLDHLIVLELPVLDEGPYDVLTGHAGARWRWVDVRSAAECREKPVQYTHLAVPLADLLAGEELPLDRESSLAVFGNGFEDTALAADELGRRGYREVLALSGEQHGGYDWLAYSNLT